MTENHTCSIVQTGREIDISVLGVRVPGRQKITNDSLTRSGTVCFIAVPIWQQWASKG